MVFPRFRFAIDRGGTFTDVVATVEASDGSFQVTTRKLLSRNPSAYPDAPSEGIRRVLRDFLPATPLTAKQQQGGDTHADPTALIAEAHIAEIRMGTTVATNALLERQGVRSVLVVTRGFADVLAIGNQTRPKLFDLNVVKNMPLSEVVVEATERVRVVRGDEKQKHHAETAAQHTAAAEEAGGGCSTSPPSWIETPTGHTVEVLVPIDLDALRGPLQAAYDTGIRSIAISLLHAYAFPVHEAAVVALAQAIGFTNISASHRLMPMVKYVPRTTTASVDAYLSPLITAYIASFRQNFSHGLQSVNLLFIQSDGALARADDFFGYRAVLSGPAGGVVGCAATTAHDLGPDVCMVGFDMGGTSTDVCRCEGLAVSHVAEAEIAGTTLQAPQVEVHTVAAGGGSILAWVHGMYVVGPESAGAMPGPACYGNGGPLTVTDANLLLGRIRPEFFPKSFGPHANQGIDLEASRQKFLALRASIAATTKDSGADASAVPSIEEMAESFILVANETMCRAIRNLTESKGYRGAEHVLTVFGGAGGQHACAVAKNLGMTRVYLHKYASFLSAVGASLTDVVVDQTQPCLLRADREEDIQAANQQLRALAASAKKALLDANSQKQGLSDTSSSSITNSSVAHVELEHIYFMRFEGTSTALPVTATDGGLSSSPALIAAFEAMYQAQFGFLLQKRAILIDDIKVRARGVSPMAAAGGALGPKPATYEAPYHPVPLPAPGASSTAADDSSSSSPTVLVYFSGKSVATRTLMAWPRPGTQIAGPAIICGNDTTVVVEPQCTAFITENGNMVLHTNTAVEAFSTALHPLALSIFSQRFMSIAEQMGYALQRTSISTNIKERLDFSCAIFDRDGQLVANAPHIPVHLGAMGAAVRWQRDCHGAAWAEDDVMVSNHPSAGGSHLPDITVMTPCWHNGQPIFYVASRGHHADVGGSTPGSMPPFSASLAAEGIPIKTFRLVKGGVFQDDGIRAVLSGTAPCEGSSGGGGLAGVQGCRAIEDNLSDLRAQVAANHRGVELVKGLIAAYGIDVVLSYMKHIQAAAEGAARQVLRGIAQRYGTSLTAADSMDDGTRIALEVRIDAASGDAVFDFAGTGSQVMGSTNCPTAVVHSAIIYAIRCLVCSDIPLNQGCMAPVTVRVPPASILAPEEDCAVVAGNVLTSQRVTDVIFTALQACACSQGCMNNFTMGNAAFGYYETICGGMGAGETFDGASAVQCHMTNTRITDPELLELRYPVLLRQFAIRRGTGGAGQHRGGDGVTRSMLFLEPMTVCLLTERRAMPPRGIRGGLDGQRGVNVLMLRMDAAAHRLPPSAMLRAASSSDDNGGTLRQLMWAADSTTTSRAHATPLGSDVSAAGVFSCRSLGGKNVVEVRRGDVVVVHSPGGGGFGVPIAAE